MKKWMLALVLATLMVGVGFAMILQSTADAETAVVTPQQEETVASLSFPSFSEAWFTGTWCYISCSDGSFDEVRTFSTQSCCSACANFCSTGCVAGGQGPSVLCDEGH